MNKERYADVAPAIPLPAASRQTYTYKLPVKLQRNPRSLNTVTIPFGSRTVPGVIVKLHRRQPPWHRLKAISSISPVWLTPEQLQFAAWIARVCQGGLGYTLRLFLPKTKVAVNTAKPAAKLSPPLVQNLAIIDSRTQRRHQKAAAYARPFLAAGRQILFLVPEKWQITPIQRQLSIIHDHSIATYHSDLPNRRLALTWQAVKLGRCQVIVGTQASLFLPFRNLGLIMLEEEQLPTHKLWDQYPRLDNRPAARQLAKIHHASMLYTTSFPSLRLSQQVASHEVSVLKTPHSQKIRAAYFPFSDQDRLRRNVLPDALVNQLRSWRRQNKRVLLYYNRRQHDLLSRILRKNRLAADNELLIISTSAVFARAGKKFNHVVWLYPDSDLKIPDFRTRELALVTLARLHSLTTARQIYITPRRGQTIELFDDIESSINNLLADRQRQNFPPFSDLIRLTITAKTRPASWNKAVKIRQQIDTRLEKNVLKNESSNPSPKITILGPYNKPKKLTDPKNSTYILLAGPLDSLVPLYDNLAITTADLSPAQIT